MISKEKNLITLMPPKTASNSLKQTLQNNGVNFSVPIGKKIIPKIHLKLDEIVSFFDLDSLDGFKIFQIVRNPYHKFVSSYYHQMRVAARHNVKFIDYDLHQFINHLYKSKKSDNFLEEFYGDTTSVYENINSGKNWGGSRLFDTQTSWKNVDCDVKYFKLEDVKNDISPISEFLGLPLTFLDKVNTGPKVANYLDVIDLEIKELIDEMYNDDFISFGYEKTLN
jgi:hypothetical protein